MSRRRCSVCVVYVWCECTESRKGHVKYIYLVRSLEILLRSPAIILRSLEILFRSLEIPIAFSRNSFTFFRNNIQLLMKRSFYFVPFK